MSRFILISVLIGYVFVGFEGLTDGSGPVTDADQDHGHEVHSQMHVDNHEHDGDSDHDDHFCHCSAHAAAIFSLTAPPAAVASHVSAVRFDSRFSSRAGPPLLRPPNA
jgi:hypothetical protein